MGIGLDNANANIGETNSIKSRAREKNDYIITAGCPCYIFHNASNKASNTFNNITGFDISNHCVDLHYWFDKSSKCKCALKEYYDFCDLEYVHIIKFISPLWLWLELCVNRELKKYSGLECYYQVGNFADRRFKCLQTSFNDSMTDVYLLFNQAVLPCFTNFKKFFQHEEPLIHKLYDWLQCFMSRLACRFIKPSDIQNHKDLGNPFSTLSSDYQDRRNDIALRIGIIT